jgi:hypothetical protein
VPYGPIDLASKFYPAVSSLLAFVKCSPKLGQQGPENSSSDWPNLAGAPHDLSIDQMYEGAQAQHLGIAQDMPTVENCHIRLVVTLSRTPSKMAARPPEFGEQTDEVLAEFGFDADAEQTEAALRS